MAPPQTNGTNFSQSFNPQPIIMDDAGIPNGAREPIAAGNTLLGQENPVLPEAFQNRHAYNNFSSEGQAFPNSMYNAASSNRPMNGVPRYDPAQLLNPRGWQNTQQQQQLNGQGGGFNQRPSLAPQQTFMFDSPGGLPAMNGSAQSYGNEIYYAGNGQNQNVGMGAMMERQHGVVDRSTRPQKRRKMDDGSDQLHRNKAAFNGGEIRRGGVLGNSIRESQEQGRKEAMANPRMPIDLTLDDDDDDLIIVKSTRHSQDPKDFEEVCYGRIQDAKINVHQVPTPSKSSLAAYHNENFWPIVHLNPVERIPPSCKGIYFRDCTGFTVGGLDQKTALGLNIVLDHVKELRMSVRILQRPRRADDLPAGSSCSLQFGIDLVIYGPRHRAAAVGTMLSQKNVWLRTPTMVTKELVNPHAHMQPPPQRPTYSSSTIYTSGSAGMRTVEEVRHDVLSVFDSMEKTEQLPFMDPDPRITTELLAHQKQGLYFMTNKEKERVYGNKEIDNSSLWRLKTAANGSKSYYNVITGQEERQSPPQVLGGILADMMGLGKTLSIISLLVGSLEESAEWAKNGSPPNMNGNAKGNASPEDDLLRVKSTLLVCPLSTISNWEDQIKQHVQPGSIKYYIYHGGARCKDIKKLADFDLVITTYGSVGSEFAHQGKKGSGVYPIQSAKWFRIVLDEAHMIREQSTQQSKSICGLSAQRRWAVTGTPVQNRLEDLGALLKFLRLNPFNEKNAFVQYILAPMKAADPDVVAKLRILVDSVTLRRLKDKIDLPKRIDRVTKLPFSFEEQRLYDIFAKNANDRVQVMATGGGIKSFSHILHSITRLRLICAHGQSLLSNEDMKITEGLTDDQPIELVDSDSEEQAKPALTSQQAYNLFRFMAETSADKCAMCNRELGPGDDDDSDRGARDETTGVMISCMNVLCTTCFKEYEPTAKISSQTGKKTHCQLCHESHRISFIVLKQNQIDQDEAALANVKDSKGRKMKKVLTNYSGPHTKTKQLVQDLLKNGEDSQTLVAAGEMPIKSVVFSTWTSHLDLIQKALEAAGIQHTRLDGTMTRPARTEAMRFFKEDKEVTVILVSIMAGGMGLNLTAASKVYVMEPQFNPAAEAQAVDRVHRLGQKREVETVRYIMDNSFEEKMIILQEKKKKLASLSMDVGNKGKAMSSLGLEELRDLFK